MSQKWQLKFKSQFVALQKIGIKVRQHLSAMNKMSTPSAFEKFIKKIRRLNQSQEQVKKQKQMQAKQQFLQNEDLYDLSVELLKETLDQQEFDIEEFLQDRKFPSYVKSLQNIGIILSKDYMEREKELQIEILKLKTQNTDFGQKLSNYMVQNQDLKQMIDQLQNEQKVCTQQLNKSEHQIEYKKHEILNEINTNKYLLKENKKLQLRNHEFSEQISNLKKQIHEIHLKLDESTEQNQKLQNQLSEKQRQIQKIQKLCDGLQQDCEFYRRQYQYYENKTNSNIDYVVQNQLNRESEDVVHSYFNYHPHIGSSVIKSVLQENEDAGSDKEVMKDIEAKGYLEAIHILNFTRSKSISRNSQQSQTSINVQHIPFIPFEDYADSNLASPEHYGNKKPLKTQRKRKQSSSQKPPQNKSCNKLEQKKKENSNTKVPITTTYAKPIQKPTNNKPITEKKTKLQIGPKKKLDMEFQRNSSEENNSKVKNKRFKSNASVVQNYAKGKEDEYKKKIAKNTRILHSQSVEDLYGDDNSQCFERQAIRKELFTKQRMIQSLKLQNKSVRQIALDQSEKRTDAQHEYEEQIDKLKSEVDYFKKQFAQVYNNYVEEKVLRKSHQDEMQRLSELIQQHSIEYQQTKNQLKIKCKQLIEDKIRFYKEKYEEICEKMNIIEQRYLNPKKCLNEAEIEGQNEENPKQLKKCKSNSLFYKEVKHHSYNTSQEYSDINHLSADHSKNTSFINIDDEQAVERKPKNSSNILIYDCGEDEMQEGEQNYEDLCSYRSEKQICDFGVQTEVAWLEDDSSYKISLEYSKMNEVQDSSQINYDFSSLGLRSSQELSKIKIFLEDRFQKIKRFKIYQMESIVVESERSFISQFDANAFSPKGKDISCLTADQSHLYKMKESSPLCLEKAFAFTIDEFKTKSDYATSTSTPRFSLVKNDSVSVKASKRTYILTKSNVVSQVFQPQTKLKIHVQDMEVQTNNSTLDFSEFLSFSFAPHKKELFDFGTQKDNIVRMNKETQINPIEKNTSMQTVGQILCLTSLFSESFDTKLKSFQTVSIQTEELQSSICSLTMNETVYPFQNIKNHHNQSFIQERFNEVIIDMSQSFEMSENFIETLKKKLLQINQNLKHLEQQKQHDASSFSSNGVQKIFNQIEMDVDMCSRQNNILIQTIPKFNLDCFQGNVKTFKASTNSSISTSLSFHSPYRHETQEVKMKVPQFQQILEIQTENVDSLTRIQAQNIQIYPYNHSSCKGSVNRSAEHENILCEDLLIESFRQPEFKANSGKKYQESIQKYERILGSPKNHMIHKQKILSSKNNPKSRQLLDEIKTKSGRTQKPKQLSKISQKDFDFICQRFRAKRMKFIEKKQVNEIKNESTDISDCYMYHNLSSCEFMVIFCKQVYAQNSIDEKLQVIIVNESQILSLTKNYGFEASRIVVSSSGDRVIFGNHEISLTENQLKFSLKNKVNHFTGHFPSQMSHHQIESAKQKEFKILKMLKYKFR